MPAGGDSGFSSRRSSVDQQNRTPDLGLSNYSQRAYQKKPKQLDRALWVGNLPDSTTHEELEEFFADENMEVSNGEQKLSSLAMILMLFEIN
jgi:hypothetical protein